jgi:hypothetical protein
MLIGKFSRALEGQPRRTKNITGHIRYQSLREKAMTVCGYSPELMVRITSFGMEPGNGMANLGYISRNDDNARRDQKELLELETDRDEILSGADAIK